MKQIKINNGSISKWYARNEKPSDQLTNKYDIRYDKIELNIVPKSNKK